MLYRKLTGVPKTSKAIFMVKAGETGCNGLMNDDFQRLEDHQASSGNNSWQSEGEILASRDKPLQWLSSVSQASL
jgi:hypothetical protein